MASPSVDVYVKLPSGRTSTLLMWPSDLVNSICDKIGKEEGVDSQRVRLKYQGKVLSRTSSIGYLGIRAETILKGEIIIPKAIVVKIKLPDGRCEDVTTQNISTVSDLNDKLGLLCSDTGRKVLKLGERELSKGGQSLYELGISDGCELRLDVYETSVGEDLCAESEKDCSDENVDEREKQKLLSSFGDASGRNVEVVFSFDTTGSMSSCLAQVRTKLKECCIRLIRDIQNIRIGLIAHGDYCDYSGNNVFRYVDLTSDTDALVDFAQTAPPTTGGDAPECYEWVLRKAQTMDWSEHSAKALVVIGDCEPHPPQYTDQNVNWHTELDVLKGMGVKVYGVQALNNRAATPFYEELADRTEGCYLRLRHFHAITDMFLAVCYREADAEQLEEFVEEMRQEGRMTEDTAAMMTKLEEQTSATPKRRQTRYVKEPWWDPNICTTKQPDYIYHANEDRWEPYTQMNAGQEDYDSTPPISTHIGTMSTYIDTYRPVVKKRNCFRRRMCCWL
ncbi:hypothetical protein ScPMuIL_018661 [Solemya velum]